MQGIAARFFSFFRFYKNVGYSAATVSYYYLIKFFNQISRGSRGIFSAAALKICLMQNLYAPYGAIKTFKGLKVFMRF